MIGKFKNAQALWYSYQCLEKEFTKKCQQIKQMEGKDMKVYELKIDWSTNDDSGCTTELYDSEEKAIKAMNFEIAQAMQDYGVFNEETSELIDDGWELDTGVNMWELWEDGYYASNHCLIVVTAKDVL